MNVDEILADPTAALDLPDGSVPVSIIVLCEFLEPGSDELPGTRRLAVTCDDQMPPWTAIGMCRYAMQLDLHAATDDEDEDG